MKRMLAMLVLGACLTALPARADDIAPGTWKLSTVSAVNGNIENTACLLKLETKNGKTTATLLAADPRYKNLKLVSFDSSATSVRIVLNNGATDAVFEGIVGKDSKKIVGVFGPEGTPAPASLVSTEMTTLEAKDATRNLGMDEMARAAALLNAGPALRNKALQTKDADDRKKLLADAAEAEQKANRELPGIYREVVSKYPDTVAATVAALWLIQRSDEGKVTNQDYSMWAETASKAAGLYGPVWQMEVDVKLAQALLTHKQDPIALDFAQRAQKALTANAPAERQLKVYELLQRALNQAGKTEEAKLVAVQINAIETVLDKEYLAKVPPFKPAAFTGRKGDSKRVVVMELFTGAQCPPCVAADVAFDALQKTYKSSELVLIQYHLHIPLPDPLTNSDTVARAAYYGFRSTGKRLIRG